MVEKFSVGDKVMTIGGFVGTIVEINQDSDRFLINVGTDDEPTKVTVVRNAIRSKI